MKETMSERWAENLAEFEYQKHKLQDSPGLEDSYIAEFGYMTRRGNEFFKVVDFGNIRKFITSELTLQREQIRESALKLKKTRQFPLAEKVSERVYDCDVTAYNQALSDILSVLKE